MIFQEAHPALARALSARDYAVPTAVQTAVLDANAASRDLLVSAQTGSGKTVAFGLAFAPTLLGDLERFAPASAPLALIIAPTRELALQVARELTWLYAQTGARIITCVGGMDARVEARQLSSGAHIVVGTPGRLRDHMERQRLDVAKLKAVVLDEADEMLDLGFREDLEFILEATPATRQTLLFSATMPRAIEALAKRFQRDAVRIETTPKGEQHADIEYQAIRVSPSDVEAAVVNTLRLHETRAALIFCATRESVKRMHARLVKRGFSAVCLSGELSQAERTHALDALREGRSRVLVATDVAARGLDLPDLTLVIHADLPNDSETLLHRSGRTGRAGKKGLCVMIVPFNRKRKAELLLGAARLKATWINPPTPQEIQARDQERFLADDIFSAKPSEVELAQARTLALAKSADEIAVALIRMHQARLPAPEIIAPDLGPPARNEKAQGYVRRERPLASNERDASDGASSSRPARARAGFASRVAAPGDADPGFAGPRLARPPREDGRPMIWFRLNIGRERNADPKWILPLICKAGDVSKSEIGLIRIFDRDTHFQILADRADQFSESARTAKTKEGTISRVQAPSAADEAVVSEAISTLAKPHAPAQKQAYAAKPGPRAHTEPRLPPKAPWRDRKAPQATTGYRSAQQPAHAKVAQPLAAGAAPSKYAKKKKHRKGPSAASG